MKRKWICYYATANKEKYKLFDDVNAGLAFYEKKYNAGLSCLFTEL